MATSRDVAASMAARVEDEFRRSGLLPTELVQHIQASAVRRGDFPTTEQVEDFTREWMERLLVRKDAKVRRAIHGDDKVDRAVDTLVAVKPDEDPIAWALALEIVQKASEAGELSREQTSRLDALNDLYASRSN